MYKRSCVLDFDRLPADGLPVDVRPLRRVGARRVVRSHASVEARCPLLEPVVEPEPGAALRE